MIARIFQPCRSAMQAGSGGVGSGGDWVLEFPRSERVVGDDLMGWPSSCETMHMVRLRFPSLDSATAYARGAGLAFRVQSRGQSGGRRSRSYADNFSRDRRQSWTH